MLTTTKSWTHETTSEAEAYTIIDDYRAKQNDEGFTIINANVKFTIKKDKKSGEVLEEKWIVTVKVSYMI